MADPGRRFLVTWRDGQDVPGLHDVACLEFDGDFTFWYLAGTRAAHGFLPLPGLSDLNVKHGPAEDLFPAIAGRLMDRDRPDFPAYAAALGLPPDVNELELLARSGGVSRGDTLAFTEEPQVAPNGATEQVFLVRGLRYAQPDRNRREQVLAELAAGAPLAVEDEPENKVSHKALRLMSAAGHHIGWVPDALTSYVRTVVEGNGRIVVHQINGPEQPAHSRLLARVRGVLPLGAMTLPPLGRRKTAVPAGPAGTLVR